MSLYARRLAYTIVMRSVKNFDLHTAVARAPSVASSAKGFVSPLPAMDLNLASDSFSPGQGRSGLGGKVFLLSF